MSCTLTACVYVLLFVSNNITVTASGSDIGGLTDQFNLNYQPLTG